MSDGGPAFPRVGYEFESAVRGDMIWGDGCPGMSLRDWFAGQALGSISWKMWFEKNPSALDGPSFADELARCAYLIADAMLAEPQKRLAAGETGG